MANLINYINRYRLPQYNSIEELFEAIYNQVSKSAPTKWTTLSYSGASIFSLINNLWGVPKKKQVIYHITGDVNYMALKFGKQSILTVHDVNSALRGSYFKKQIISWLWFKLPAEQVKFITVISEFTKEELTKIIPRHKQKIRVIYNPINPALQPALDFRFDASNPKILCIGTKKNKNLERTINAVKGLKVKLIVIGELSELQAQILKKNEVNYKNQSQLSFEEVVQVYKNCDMVCFPSLYEGFGMPIIEAQATGRPVLTSNLGAMKEVAGEAAHFVDPYNEKEIREGIITIINNRDYRNDLVKKGFQNVKRFHIKKISNQYVQLYNQML